jgi:hypothetical protein
MEAEYVALSTSCRDLFPLIDITKELCDTLKVNMTTETKMIMEIYQIFEPKSDEGVITVPINNHTFISSIEDPYCLSGRSVQTGLIIDSGASVCITPHRSDFINYRPSQMKIRDLSSSNSVAGEGIIRWSVQDMQGNKVDIELLGYHIPTAEVRLLSPQVLLNTIGGYSKQTVHGVQVFLDNGITLGAAFCPRSNLPLIPLAHEASSKPCFWTQAFGFSVDSFQDLNSIRNVLHQNNTNLSNSQKELLLWHQRLSHASVKWIQVLMRDRKWLPTGRTDNVDPALHSGPFIRTRAGSRAHCCDGSTLHCAACLYAKASTRTPSNLAPRPSTKNNILKRDHLKPGDCISADHYFSPINGRLPHTYGRERNGYTCGSLFVDHASGKIFNFPQYSNTATETIRSAMRLEAMARDEGFKIKSYHSDNGIFSSPDFKQHCSLQNQKYNFGAVGAKHQNGIAERNIKTVAQ